MAVSDTDAYYKVYKGFHLFTYEALPSIDNALRVWHTNLQPTLPACMGKCPDGKKPKLPTACQSCVDWGSAVEASLYHPPGAPGKPQATWQNINASNLSQSHVEAAKAFVLRLPKTKGSPRYTKVSDFDSASVLMIMTRFRGFHGGDQASFDTLTKVAELRNELSHLGLQKNMLLDDQKVRQYFQDLQDAVTCLENLHPNHFTAAQDVRAKLYTIQMEPITSKMKKDIHLELQEELANLKDSMKKEVGILKEVVSLQHEKQDSMKEEMTSLKEAVGLQRDKQAHTYDLTMCQNQLKADYTDSRGGIGFLPGMPKEFPLEDFFVDLCLVQEEKRPTELVQKELTKYTDLLTLESKLGRRLGHVLVRGDAGTGKTTLINQLANQWATNTNDDNDDDDIRLIQYDVGSFSDDEVYSVNVNDDISSHSLNKFDLLFALNIRQMKPDMDLADCIHDQLLPDVHKDAIQSMLIDHTDKCLFLFDGYDEMKSQQNVLSSKLLHRSFVIVTTRPDKVDQFCLTYNGYVHVKVSGFSKESRECFVKKYFAASSTKQSNFLDKVEQSYLSPLSLFPLLLAMMCSIFNTSGKIPLRMTELYTEVVQVFASQYYCKTSKVANLSKSQMSALDVTLLSLGSTALRGLLIDDTKLIFDSEDFERGCQSQFANRNCIISVSCGVLSGCVGLELGIRLDSLYIKFLLTIVGFVLVYFPLMYKLSSYNIIKVAENQGILTKVYHNASDTTCQFPFLHKTFQEFCAAKYWASLAVQDKSNFEFFLQKINKDNVKSMQYLLRFCCGLSYGAAAMILHHVVRNCDHGDLYTEKSIAHTRPKYHSVKWCFPITLLFEAETDSHVHPSLHGILKPVNVLEISDYHNMTSELWSILKHYSSKESDGNHVQTWLSNIEELTVDAYGFNIRDCMQLFKNCIEMASINKFLKSFQIYFESEYNGCFDILTRFLICQVHLEHLTLHGFNYVDYGNFLLNLFTTPIGKTSYIAHLVPNLKSLSLVYLHNISTECWEYLLDAFIAAGQELQKQHVTSEAHSLPIQHFNLNVSTILAREKTDKLLYKFGEALSFMSQLRFLGLREIKLTHVSLEVLAPAISRMFNLQTLDLAWNPLGGFMSGGVAHHAGLHLSQILQNVRNLTELDLRRAGLRNDDFQSLTLTHESKLTKLNLRFNDFGSQGLIHLCASLKHMPMLTWLDLRYNRFGTQGLIHLSASLQHMPMLTRLDLLGNRVDKEGVAVFSESLHYIPLLTYLSMSVMDDASIILLADRFIHVQKLKYILLSDYNRPISVEAVEAIFRNLIHLPQLEDLSLHSKECVSDIHKSKLVHACSKEVTCLQTTKHLDFNPNDIKTIVRVVKRFDTTS